MLGDLNMTIFCVKGSIHFRVISTGTRVNITLCIKLYLIHLALLLLFLHFIFIKKQWFWYLLYMLLYCISLTRALFLKQSGFGFKTIGKLDICFSLPTLSLSISYFLFLLKRSLMLHLTWHFSLQPKAKESALKLYLVYPQHLDSENMHIKKTE